MIVTLKLKLKLEGKLEEKLEADIGCGEGRGRRSRWTLCCSCGEEEGSSKACKEALPWLRCTDLLLNLTNGLNN